MWFLSFDCATKTFAFCVCRVGGAEPIAPTLARLRREAAAAGALLARARADPAVAAAVAGDLRRAVARLDAETAALFAVADSETVDLFPGRADADVSTVERLRAVARYVEARVRPARRAAGAEGCPVLIEYQMGPNSRARAVAAALVTLFAEDPVCFVGPALKNRVAAAPELALGRFTERYSTAYGANKAHTLHNVRRLAELFPVRAPADAARLGHVADCVMQVLGHLAYGPEKGAELRF